MMKVKDVDYELVAKLEVIQLHLRDHSKAGRCNGRSALSDSALRKREKRRSKLKPTGALLEAKGNFKTANTRKS